MLPQVKTTPETEGQPGSPGTRAAADPAAVTAKPAESTQLLFLPISSAAGAARARLDHRAKRPPHLDQPRGARRHPGPAGRHVAADAQHGVRGRGAVPVLRAPGNRPLAAWRVRAGQLRLVLLRRPRPLPGRLAPSRTPSAGWRRPGTVSLLAMLGTTTLLYSMSRQLFNERVALCSAALFSITESAIFLGNFATYDAPALFLLALAAWIVVRTAARAGRSTSSPRRWPLARWPPSTLPPLRAHDRGAGGPRGAAVPGPPGAAAPGGVRLVVAALLAGALRLAGRAYRQGIAFTTRARRGHHRRPRRCWDSLLWGGVPFAVACVIGAVAYAARPLTEPDETSPRRGGKPAAPLSAWSWPAARCWRPPSRSSSTP